MTSHEIPFWPRLTAGERPARAFLILGTCQAGALVPSMLNLNIRADHYLVESYLHSQVPDVDFSKYDAVVIGTTLRHILHHATGKSVVASDATFARLRNEEDVAALVAACKSIIDQRIASLHESLPGLPVFFNSIFEPSYNYLGNLVGRHDPTSPVEVVRRINKLIYDACREYPNFHFVEVNDILNWVGRAHIQDDAILSATHASIIADHGGLDQGRLVPPINVEETYETRRYIGAFVETFWRIVCDDLDVIRPEKPPVKLIVIDLDDTLWRGIAAEDDRASWERVEGWPIGFVEALLFFRKRGGLLAVCSKNDHDSTLQRLNQIYDGAIGPDDFVSMKINWESKANNIGAILEEVNLLPDNVLFIDDNPREIDEVAARFPTLQCFRGSHYDWRRLILRAAETQVPLVTKESQTRTESTRALIKRSEQSTAASREEWLKSLDIHVSIQIRNTTSGPDMARVFELINKTNQFNTNGHRWTQTEFDDFFKTGGVCVYASLKDRAVDNGIIGVVMVGDGALTQAVLSCRVFGLGAEVVMGSVATRIALARARKAKGSIVDTGRNFTCHGYFDTLGFQPVEDGFATEEACAFPDWTAVSVTDETGLYAATQSDGSAGLLVG